MGICVLIGLFELIKPGLVKVLLNPLPNLLLIFFGEFLCYSVTNDQPQYYFKINV